MLQVMVSSQARAAAARLLTLTTLYVVCVAGATVVAWIIGFIAALIAWGATYGWAMGWHLVGG